MIIIMLIIKIIDKSTLNYCKLYYYAVVVNTASPRQLDFASVLICSNHQLNT